MQIETDRLMLRAVEREDAGPTHYWNRDPEVMRHLGGVTHPELEAFTEFMGRIEAKYAAYRERGLPWQAFVVVALIAMVAERLRGKRARIDRVGCMPWMTIFLFAAVIGGGLLATALPALLKG